MKFAEYIKEQLTTYTTIRVIEDTKFKFTEEFQVDEVLYKLYWDTHEDVWNCRIDAVVDFKEKKPQASGMITNPSTVLNNILKSIELFLEKKKPQGFVIITKNDSMKRVINRIIPVLKTLANKRKQNYWGKTSSGYEHRFTFNKDVKEDK